MTIYTTEQALNPEKKENHDDCVDVEIQTSDEKKALTSGTRDDDYTVYNDTTIPVVSANRAAAARRQRQIRRRNMWLLPLLLLGMIIGITMCIFGSLQLWKGSYYTVDGGTYKGRCGVGIVDMSKYNTTDKAQALKSAQTEVDNKPDEARQVDYVEDIDISGSLETMNVPKKGDSSAAVVRHDFDRNFTAIRDDLRQLCLLVPFLTEFLNGMVPEPGNFSFYLQKIETEHTTPMVYEQDEYFQAIAPVDNMSEYGAPLAEICDGLKAFRTEPTSAKATTKAPSTTTRKPTTPRPTTPLPTTDMLSGSSQFAFEDWYYTMYPGGDALYRYHMLFPDDLDIGYDYIW